MKGISELIDFLTKHYLENYINLGGSKIKFLTGRPQSGKTYFLKQMQTGAEGLGYRVASFSAKQVWLHDFKEIYVEIFEQVDIEKCLEGCARRIVENMGFHYEDIPAGMTFNDYLAMEGQADALTKREIRLQLKELFLNNPYLDNNFAIACSLITGGILGHPVLESQSKDLLLSWMRGDKSVKLALLRAMGLAPSKITKLNARHMLRSLSEVVHLGGFPGIFVCIDDMQQLISKSGMEEIHYTKLRREDTYESIRQLIDEIDSMHYIMFFLGFDRELIDNENYGIKAYQALWMRIQNEVVGKRFNRFQDILDLDRYARQEFTPEVLRQIWDSILQNDLQPECEEYTAEIEQYLIKQSVSSGIGLMGLMKKVIYEKPALVDGE